MFLFARVQHIGKQSVAQEHRSDSEYTRPRSGKPGKAKHKEIPLVCLNCQIMMVNIGPTSTIRGGGLDAGTS